MKKYKIYIVYKNGVKSEFSVDAENAEDATALVTDCLDGIAEVLSLTVKEVA